MAVTVYQGQVPSWAYADPYQVTSYNNSTPLSPFRMAYAYGANKFQLQTGAVQQNGTGQIYVFQTKWIAPLSSYLNVLPDFWKSWASLLVDTGATNSTSTDPNYNQLVQVYIAASNLSLGTVAPDGSAICTPVSRTVATQNDAFPSGSLPLCLVGSQSPPTPGPGATGAQTGPAGATLGPWRPDYPVPGEPPRVEPASPIRLFVDKRTWGP